MFRRRNEKKRSSLLGKKREKKEEYGKWTRKETGKHSQARWQKIGGPVTAHLLGDPTPPQHYFLTAFVNYPLLAHHFSTNSFSQCPPPTPFSLKFKSSATRLYELWLFPDQPGGKPTARWFLLLGPSTAILRHSLFQRTREQKSKALLKNSKHLV